MEISEYLVTMTTAVPPGVSDSEVADMRAREAAHTAELAGQGRVLRLWRPPLGPGEWRTLGLFAASDHDDLEHVLAGMPLRIWRTDEVTALEAHSNDPGRGAVALDSASTEFLTTFVVSVPGGTSDATVDELTEQEAVRTRQLAAARRLIRLWRLPGPGRNLGDWQAEDADQMRDVLDSLPMRAWLVVDSVPLTRHPSDPALTSAAR